MAVRKIAVVGSNAVKVNPPLGAQIVDLLREFDPADTAILTRGSGRVEQFVADVAVALQMRCFSYPGTGGRDNLDRDDELVADADEVIAILDPFALDDPRTGTARLVEKALAAKVPVRAGTVVGEDLVWA